VYRRILEGEIENWKSYVSGLNNEDKDLFYQMLKLTNKYYPLIEAKEKVMLHNL
jgi:hypothetical protein